MKLCIHCQHFDKPTFTPAKYAKCKADSHQDKVTGKGGTYCSIAREHPIQDFCGPKGTFFTPKDQCSGSPCTCSDSDPKPWWQFWRK